MDFVCLKAKLIVEVDGRQHEWEADYDAERSRALEGMGFTILRVTNAEVRDKLGGVLGRIEGALRPGWRQTRTVLASPRAPAASDPLPHGRGVFRSRAA